MASFCVLAAKVRRVEDVKQGRCLVTAGGTDWANSYSALVDAEGGCGGGCGAGRLDMNWLSKMTTMIY
jgi:hypothetical protein